MRIAVPRDSPIRARSLFFATIRLAQSAALAQACPAKPIRMVVPYPPCGVNDIVARLSSLPELLIGAGWRIEFNRT